MTIETCDVCGQELIESDGYLSCPIYVAGKTKEADEHTSYEIKER